MSPKANSIGVFTGGWFTADDGSVWPDPSLVANGTLYGPNGDDYTGTLGAGSPRTQSVFDEMFAACAQPVLMATFAITGDYVVKATGVTKSDMQVMWENSPQTLQEDDRDMNIAGMRYANIYDDAVNGIAAPAVGDTLSRDDDPWVVCGWEPGPGRWRLMTRRLEGYHVGRKYIA